LIHLSPAQAIPPNAVTLGGGSFETDAVVKRLERASGVIRAGAGERLLVF
jgi:hypothetical protein